MGVPKDIRVQHRNNYQGPSGGSYNASYPTFEDVLAHMMAKVEMPRRQRLPSRSDLTDNGKRFRQSRLHFVLHRNVRRPFNTMLDLD